MILFTSWYPPVSKPGGDLSAGGDHRRPSTQTAAAGSMGGGGERTSAGASSPAAACAPVDLSGPSEAVSLPERCTGSTCTSVGPTSLSDLVGGDCLGVSGGLYCGTNERPVAYETEGRALAERGEPRAEAALDGDRSWRARCGHRRFGQPGPLLRQQPVDVAGGVADVGAQLVTAIERVLHHGAPNASRRTEYGDPPGSTSSCANFTASLPEARLRGTVAVDPQGAARRRSSRRSRRPTTCPGC